MPRVFTCPKCGQVNTLPDDADTGDEKHCWSCGQKVRLDSFVIKFVGD